MSEMRVGPWLLIVTIILSIVWVVGMGVRVTSRWIPWENFFENIPYIVLGLILAHVVVHFTDFGRKSDDQ